MLVVGHQPGAGPPITLPNSRTTALSGIASAFSRTRPATRVGIRNSTSRVAAKICMTFGKWCLPWKSPLHKNRKRSYAYRRIRAYSAWIHRTSSSPRYAHSSLSVTFFARNVLFMA